MSEHTQPLIVEVPQVQDQDDGARPDTDPDQGAPERSIAAGSAATTDESMQDLANRILKTGIQISPAVIGISSERILDHYQCLGCLHWQDFGLGLGVGLGFVLAIFPKFFPL